MSSARTTSDREPYWFAAFPFPPRHFRVHAIRGREALSRPYWFDVTVTSSALAGDGLERISVGHRASLVVQVGDAPRVVPGFVESVRADGLRENGTLSQATFRLVPMLALLRHQRRSRIFQDMSIDQVVDAVLGAAGIATRWQLERREPTRAYITQYEESDLAFVERLLAESGIFYWFGAADDAFADVLAGARDVVGAALVDPLALVGSAAASLRYPEETVVLADESSAYPRLPLQGGESAPSLFCTTAEAMAIDRRDQVSSFVTVQRVRSEIAEYREHDPSRPLTPLSSRVGDGASSRGTAIGAGAGGLTSSTATEVGSPGSSAAFALEPRVSVGSGAFAEALQSLVAQRGFETYEHHGHFLFPDLEDAGVAERIRRRRTKKRVTARGESNCPALSPGHRFRLEDHPSADQNREHVVVWVEHRGQVAEGRTIYASSFRCVPATVLYSPSQGRRKTVQSLLTATVVGPPGEEIHVDAEGRIKVHFHWDRRGPSATSSCWLRTVQPWGGVAFGHQFIPRVGMEVAVTFEGGDPDKPVVVGSLYNRTHPTPFALPENKTQSGIRTRSTPGGDGFNELMFEDAKGREKVHLQAERDLEELVKHDMQTHVLADQLVNVGQAQSIRIGETRRLDVGGDHVERVAESHSELVGADKTTEIGEDRRLTVHGNDHESIRGTRTTTVDGRLSVHAGEHCGLSVGDGKNPATVDAYAYGTLTVGAEGAIRLSSMKSISLVCGDTVLEITKDGIRLGGDTLRLKAEKSLTAAGNGPSLVLDENALLTSKTVRIVSKKASLVLDDDGHLDGLRVLLNCKGFPPPLLEDKGKPQKTKKLTLTLSDPGFVSHAGKAYLLAAGGASFEGTTDADGKVEHDIPEATTSAELVLFIGQRPDGERRRYTIAIEDALDVTQVRGALTRLQNLGYFWGEPDDVLDPLATRALKDFQQHNALEPTGALDEQTIAKLRDRHGH